MIDLVSELYSVGVFPSLPCPLPLFLSIIHINQIRYQVGINSMACLDNSVQASVAHVFEQIGSFVPESWIPFADEGAFPNEWCLIAQIFQSAVALFASATLPWLEPLLSLPLPGLSLVESP